MPRARFRIQTIMIVIAAFAVLLVLLKSLTQPFQNMVVFAAAVIVLGGGNLRSSSRRDRFSHCCNR